MDREALGAGGFTHPLTPRDSLVAIRDKARHARICKLRYEKAAIYSPGRFEFSVPKKSR